MRIQRRVLARIVLLLALSIAPACENDSSAPDVQDVPECNPTEIQCDTIASDDDHSISVSSDILSSNHSYVDAYAGLNMNHSSGERHYKVTVGEGETKLIRIKQVNVNFEADYLILNECDNSTDVIAFGDTEASACLGEGSYILAVDGRDGATGHFWAEISCDPCNPDGDTDTDGDTTTDGDTNTDGDTTTDGDTNADGDTATDGDTNADGDTSDGDTDGDSNEPAMCGCTCDENGENCVGIPEGTSFTNDNCEGWETATQCSGFFSVYCYDFCNEDGACLGGCHEDVVSQNLTFPDGQSYTGFGCTITIHCP